MTNYLLIQNNSRIYLLIRYTDRYHIITVNNKLDEEKEEMVLEGNYSDAVIDEMGLTRETILKTDLRGVAIGGSNAGDAIVLYIKSKKLKYVLSDDYSDEDIDAMFSGVERFTPPKNVGSKSRKAEWRTELQDESTWKIMKPIGTVLNILGVVSFFGMLVYGREGAVWPVICLLLIAVSTWLYLAYPQYFTIMDSRDYKRVGYTAKVKHLWSSIMAPALALMRQGLRFHFLDWKQMLLACIITAVLATILMYRFSREVRENTDYIFIVLVLSLLVSYGIVGHVNHLVNFGIDETQMCTVMDTRMRDGRRGAEYYYCTVTLNSGEEIELSISKDAYSQIRTGDRVPVFSGKGALGIEYAYFAAKE